MTAPSIADIEAAGRSHLCTSTDDGSLICVWCGKPWPCVVAQLLADNARLTVRIEDLERELYGIGDER